MQGVRHRRLPLLLAMCLGLAWAGLSGTDALAQTESCLKFGDVTIRAGERLDCDLNVIGGTLVIEPDAEVAGSVNAPLGDVDIGGVVGGDAYAGGELRVTGLVGGTAFAGGDLSIDGEVKGDARSLGDLTVMGTVEGDAESLGGNAEVNGAVNGSARAEGNLSLGATAIIRGGTESGGTLHRDEAAQVFGQAESAAALPAGGLRDGGFAGRLFLVLAMVFFVGIFAALAVAVAPGPVARVRDAAGGSALRSIVVGGLLLLAFPFVAWLIIPIFLYGVGACLGAVGLGELLGRRLMGDRPRMARTAVGTGLLAFVAALALLISGGSIPLLCLEALLASLFTTVVVAWGLGASTLTLLGTRAWPQAGAPAAASPVSAPGPAMPAAVAADAAAPGAEVAPATAAPTDAAPATVLFEDAAPDTEGWPETVPGDMPSVALDDAGSAAAAAVGTALASEMATGDELAPPVATSPAAGAADLRRVPGITPIYAQLLYAAGLTTVDDLARESPERLVAIASAPGVLPISVDTASQWIRNARGVLGQG